MIEASSFRVLTKVAIMISCMGKEINREKTQYYRHIRGSDLVHNFGGGGGGRGNLYPCESVYYKH